MCNTASVSLCSTAHTTNDTVGAGVPDCANGIKGDGQPVPYTYVIGGIVGATIGRPQTIPPSKPTVLPPPFRQGRRGCVPTSNVTVGAGFPRPQMIRRVR